MSNSESKWLRKISGHICGVAIVLLVTLDLRGQDLFEKSAGNLISKYCLSCHNDSQSHGNLDLSSREGFLRGGDSGPSFDESAPRESLILQRVLNKEMPPDEKHPAPKEAEIKDFEQWLLAGAMWPEGKKLSEFGSTTEFRAGYDWWSLQPLRSQNAFPHRSSELTSEYIDIFIQQRLEESGLRPNGLADKRTLLRRIKFDLHGLPPSVEELEEFEGDSRPDAWDRLIDRLLASPSYGERWGRHWLDVARYGDTHGYERDFRRPNAWRYRDFVIEAINSDQPYDEFIRWQIAGDTLAPDNPSAIIATSFLACGPYDFTGLDETPSPILKRQARADELDDILTTTVASTLGLTVNCARCHNHKVDPISQEDYYRLAAVFSGVKRGDRPLISEEREAQRVASRLELEARLAQLKEELSRLESHIDLADIVGGGNGRGSGRVGNGIDPRNGVLRFEHSAMLDDIQTNRFSRSVLRFVDGVGIPDGSAGKKTTVSSTGIQIELPGTSGQSWDFIENGPVTEQAYKDLNGVDYSSEGHSILGLHANKFITFDLAEIRRELGDGELQLEGVVGYGGRELTASADAHISLDGKTVFEWKKLKRADGGREISLSLSRDARFLTLVATDGGDGIGHDQVFFGDLRIRAVAVRGGTEELEMKRGQLSREREELELRLRELGAGPQVFGIKSTKPEVIQVLSRGNPEEPIKQVTPSAFTWMVSDVPATIQETMSDGERRKSFALWLTSSKNSTFQRVIVNRIWHYHFGQGIVATTNDFGFFGERASHPVLLDEMATEFVKGGYSWKRFHRTILRSHTYQQTGDFSEKGSNVDAENRLLWRMSPRRLDAESTRDTILSAAGSLQRVSGGPGYEDFEYVDRYAPIYRYRTADRPEQWRRSVYRFSVRSVPNQFLEVLDCPNPTVSAPIRSQTTTALQSLTLLNDPFIYQQASLMADRLRERFPNELESQIRMVFKQCLLREPMESELRSAKDLVEQAGLDELCRVIFNANEFVYVD